MKRKSTKSTITTLAAIIMALFFCISCAYCAVAEREVIAVGQCISNCVSQCSGSQNYNRCYNGCGRGCLPAAATTSSYYCNLGCSLRRCSKISHDAKMLESCLMTALRFDAEKHEVYELIDEGGGDEYIRM